MSKFFIISAQAILLVVLLSCGKDPIPSPPPVTYTVSISKIGNGTVTADKLSEIALGSSVTVKFKSESIWSLYSVKINGVKVEDIYPSDTEVMYTIRDINKNINIEVVFVETGNLLISILNPPLMLKSMKSYDENNNYSSSVDLTHEQLTKKLYFYYYSPNSKELKILKENGSSSSMSWNLSKEVLTLDVTIFYVLELTATKLVYRTPIINTDGVKRYVVYTYER